MKDVKETLYDINERLQFCNGPDAEVYEDREYLLKLVYTLHAEIAVLHKRLEEADVAISPITHILIGDIECPVQTARDVYTWFLGDRLSAPPFPLLYTPAGIQISSDTIYMDPFLPKHFAALCKDLEKAFPGTAFLDIFSQ